MSDSRDTHAHQQSAPTAELVIGTALLYGGAALGLLAVVDRVSGLPFNMPACWYVNRWLWPGLAVAAVVAGAFLLKPRRSLPATWRPSRPGRRFQQVVVYVQPGSARCEQAVAVLLKYDQYLPPLELVEVQPPTSSGSLPNANASPAPTRLENQEKLLEIHEKLEKELTEQDLPLVVADGRVLFRGRLDEQQLQNLLEETPPVQADSRPWQAMQNKDAPNLYTDEDETCV